MRTLTSHVTRNLAPVGRKGLVVRNSAHWSLRQTCHAAPKSSIDLTECLGSNRACSLGSKDHLTSANDFTIVDHGGIHLMFEEQGKHQHRLDSDSALYMTDVDSVKDVYLDGVLVPRGARVVSLEGGISFVVERNVVAHA